jgi:hypothetical protein
VSLKTEAEKLDEVVERCRRIETRLTKFMEQEGFDTQVARASWLNNGTVNVPSLAISLKEILLAIPDGHEGAVPVMHKGQRVAVLMLA